MARSETFFKRLTQLFRSGPSIRRRVKGHDYRSYYDTKLIQGNYGYQAPAPFGFGRENSPFSVLGSYGILDRMARYAEFAEMEYCLHADTKIAVPGGYKTIKELADEYGLDKEFIVYSYDHSKKKVIPAIGRQARQTRFDHAYKIKFNSGKEIIGTNNHRLMKRDGTYCEIADLKPGDAMMPFYRRSVTSNRTEGQAGYYQTIYTMDREENPYGWTAEHKLLAKFILGRELYDNEVVHHKNFLAYDNRVENLEVMTEEAHRKLHAEILNGKKWDYSKNYEWIEKFKKQHSACMRRNNPAERADITFERILHWCDTNNFNLYKVSKAFNTDNNTIKRKLASKGFENWIEFAKAYSPGWRSESWGNKGKRNPKYRSDVTFGKICDLYDGQISKKHLAEQMNVSVPVVENRLKQNGYNSWTEFANSYENHKVVSVEYYGKIPLYDLTVDEYKNFATDSVISHNTPEIASALDIYSDETVGGDDRGKSFHIYSNNINIKRNLEELFYDVLNVEFNLRAWSRNLVKYGDFFLYNEVLPEIGVINAQPIPVNEIEREEGFDGDDPYAVRFKWLTRGNVFLENWQVTHMRILGNDLFLPYGTAVLEPARRIWRQLCHAKGTKVWVKNYGYKNIEDVLSGETVVSFDYENQKVIETNVKHCIAMGKQKVVEIHTAHRKILVTPNHGLLAYNSLKGKYEYKQAKDLIVSDGSGGWKHKFADKLVLPTKWPTSKRYHEVDIDSSYYVNKKLCRKPTFLNKNHKFKTSPKFMKLFGFMFGDGWVNYKRSSVGFALGVDEKQNIKYISLLEELYPTIGKMRVTKPSPGRGGQANINSKELVLLFEKLGFKTGFDKKRIPSWVFLLNKENKIEFLQGLFDADGSKSCSRICLSNKELIEDVRMLCQQSGVPVGKQIFLDRTNGFYEDKTFGRHKKSSSYRLYVNLKKQVKDENFLLETVTKIVDPNKEVETYDLEVEHPVHNFVAEGVVSHNTMMEDAMLVYRVVRSPERRVFYIDVANVAPNDVPSYMEAAKATLRSHSVIEKNSGRADMRYNPLAVDEDYYIPVRGTQSGTKIETLAGGQHVTATEDVQYIQSKLFAALKVPKPYLNFDENLCLLGNTKIPLLCGEIKTIEELAKEHENGFNFNNGIFNNWVYSTKINGEIVPGKIKKAWKTKEIDQYYKITLDNDEIVECTENHPFLLRNGTYKRADELSLNESLMPIYRKISSKKRGNKLDGYEMVYDNKDKIWKYTHKIVNEQTAKNNGGHQIGRCRVVHHVDFNKLNNSPNNLQEMTWYSHRKFHSRKENLDKTILRPDVVEKREKTRIKWLKSDQHKKLSAEQMRYETTTPGRPLYNWIHGDKISNKMSDIMRCNWENLEYRKLKCKQNKEILQRPEVRKKIFGKNHWAYKRTKHYNLMFLIKYCKQNEIYEHKHFKQSRKNNAPFGSRVVNRILKENNITGWRQFIKTELTNNHKIKKIEIVNLDQAIPVYDVQIENPENTHNFLLNSGVVVHNSSKATLAQEDIRFSRTISGIQKIVLSEMNKLAMIHLYAKGFDGEDLIDFELKLSNPSSVAAQQKLELWATKADVAGTLKDTALVDEKWVQKNVLELTEDDISSITKGLYEDKVKEVQLDAVVFETEPERTTTTDSFSPANYNMGGANVPKAPMPPDDNTPDSERQYDGGIVGPDTRANNPFQINYTKGSTPIKATPFLTRNRKNRIRRVGQHGRGNMANPDFAAMLNPRTNRSLKDVFDMDFLHKPAKREGVEYGEYPFVEDFIPIRSELILPNDIKSILKRLKDHLDVTLTKKSMLTEEIELDIERDEDEVILDFVVEEGLEDKPFQGTKSSLKEVMLEIDDNEDEVDLESIDVELE